jgi:hypothetical protein
MMTLSSKYSMLLSLFVVLVLLSFPAFGLLLDKDQEQHPQQRKHNSLRSRLLHPLEPQVEVEVEVEGLLDEELSLNDDEQQPSSSPTFSPTFSPSTSPEDNNNRRNTEVMDAMSSVSQILLEEKEDEQQPSSSPTFIPTFSPTTSPIGAKQLVV